MKETDKVVLSNGYVLNRSVFRWLLLSLAVVVLVSVGVEGFDFKPKYYMECRADAFSGFCSNPYFEVEGCPFSEAVCSMERLPSGFSVGEKPSQWLKWLPLLMGFLILLAVVFNHFEFNRGEVDGK